MRLATVEYLPNLLKYISKEQFADQIEPIFKEYLEDGVHLVRMEAVRCMIKLKKEYLDQRWLESIIIDKFEIFVKHEKFSIRIHTLLAINELFLEISDQFLNDKIYKIYMKPLMQGLHAPLLPHKRMSHGFWGGAQVCVHRIQDG